ncbi:MAG: hypothetical protein LBD73_01805 [Deferribacteraceae bacterium]|jgi:hypothetical protein|nr:hypothetical protein [Deferribacteraceae bacterium]
MKTVSLFIAAFLIGALFLFLRGTAVQETDGKGKQVNIKITSDDMVIMATLNDSAPSRDLIKRLPITLNLHSHQNREYYADIGLAKDGNTQSGYEIGDIAYWTPGDSLVFFHREGYTGNLIKMGYITSELDTLRSMGGSFQAKIEIASDGR